MKNIALLGAGSWGTALSRLLAKNGHSVRVWSIDKNEVAMLTEFHEQKDKLPGVILPDNVSFSTDMEATVKNCEIIVMAVPSIFVRSTSKSLSAFYKEGQIIVDVAKGIEEATLKTMTEVIADEIPSATTAILSGPSHAEEVGKDIPTTVVCGAKTEEIARLIQDTFMNEWFRVYTSSDIKSFIGVVRIDFISIKIISAFLPISILPISFSNPNAFAPFIVAIFKTS